MSEKLEWSDKIDQEKSLYQVYKRSLVIEVPSFNKRCMVYGGLICASYIVATIYFGNDNNQIISAISKLSANLITISTAILGFLIAGFSIFVTLIPKSTLIALSKARYKETSISHFKEIIFNFLNVFTVYLICLVMSLTINTLCPLGWSPLITISVDSAYVVAFNSIVLGAMVMTALYSILRLKSFIWTMYQGLLVNIML